MSQSADLRDPTHSFKNQLAIIIGFADLLLADLPADDPRHKDVLEIHRAAKVAIDLLPSVLAESRASDNT